MSCDLYSGEVRHCGRSDCRKSEGERDRAGKSEEDSRDVGLTMQCV